MEIKIRKTGKKCWASGKFFEHGEEIVSLIRFKDGDYVREDYTATAWNPEFGKNVLAVWNCRYIDPSKDEKNEVFFTPLRKIFYNAVEINKRDELAVAYLAAQLLRRQKAFRLLKESENPENGIKTLLFIDKAGGKFVEVIDPNFSFQELANARQVLLARIQSLEEIPHE